MRLLFHSLTDVLVRKMHSHVFGASRPFSIYTTCSGVSALLTVYSGEFRIAEQMFDIFGIIDLDCAAPVACVVRPRIAHGLFIRNTYLIFAVSLRCRRKGGCRIVRWGMYYFPYFPAHDAK